MFQLLQTYMYTAAFIRGYTTHHHCLDTNCLVLSSDGAYTFTFQAQTMIGGLGQRVEPRSGVGSVLLGSLRIYMLIVGASLIAAVSSIPRWQLICFCLESSVVLPLWCQMSYWATRCCFSSRVPVLISSYVGRCCSAQTCSAIAGMDSLLLPVW